MELYEWCKYVNDWMNLWDIIGWICVIVFSLSIIALSVAVIRLYTRGQHYWDEK